MLYFIILAMIGGAVFLLTSNVIELRQHPHLRGLETVPRARSGGLSSFKFLQPLVNISKPIANLPYLQRLQGQSEILRINLDLTALILQKIFLSVIFAVVVFALMPQTPYWIIAAVLGFFMPDLILMSKVKSKREAIVREFPEIIDIIDLCIGAGLDFTSSIKWVIEKTESNPFIEQLEIVLKEIQVGRNRIDALKSMAKRLQIPDISSFVRTVIQSERMGTSVEEAFKNLSEDTRLMRFQAGERFAIKASLKILFPLLFFILPVIMIVVAGPIIIQFTSGDLIPKAGF